MKRLKFIKFVATFPLAGYCVPSFGEYPKICENSKTKSVPDWAEVEIRTAAARLKTWKNGKNCALFVVVTDLHSALPDNANNCVASLHIRIANRAAEFMKADAVVNLGDIGLEFPIKKDADGQRLLDIVFKHHGETEIPTLFCIGNHDHYYRRFSNEYLGRRIAPLCKTACFGESCDYGYFDIPQKKCRSFFLNSSDGAYYGMSEKQLDFLRLNLWGMPKNWAAVIFEHYCFDGRGAWLGMPVSAKNGEIFVKIMEDFAASGGRIAANITGDSHFDRSFEKNGVRYFISQGFGGITPKNIPEGVEVLKFDRLKQTLVEAVAIDVDSGEIRLFRIGAGAESRDRFAKF